MGSKETNSKDSDNGTISTVDSDPRVPASSELETLTKMSVREFVRMTTTATYAEEADDDIVACEEPSAIIVPNFQTGTSIDGRDDSAAPHYPMAVAADDRWVSSEEQLRE
eukprot:gnl/TRDRNA2_/TRDRNA2_176231_c2_seq7.p2 gnl/TRDRNA2_/TRDRNA2_176231_c2~~gnl/TRDRNA2_/TRDRNA2_176231_c2_seq7.p2  ORF type:complete len:122 (+),score=23.79 gnl/TRDRNA2_/TRDRNA2_176231_c2_seq7:37-366(+)